MAYDFLAWPHDASPSGHDFTSYDYDGRIICFDCARTLLISMRAAQYARLATHSLTITSCQYWNFYIFHLNFFHIWCPIHRMLLAHYDLKTEALNSLWHIYTFDLHFDWLFWLFTTFLRDVYLLLWRFDSAIAFTPLSDTHDSLHSFYHYRLIFTTPAISIARFVASMLLEYRCRLAVYLWWYRLRLLADSLPRHTAFFDTWMFHFDGFCFGADIKVSFIFFACLMFSWYFLGYFHALIYFFVMLFLLYFFSFLGFDFFSFHMPSFFTRTNFSPRHFLILVDCDYQLSLVIYIWFSFDFTLLL